MNSQSKATKSHWSLKEDLKFITTLREFPILWDTSHPNFTDANTRERAWKKIQKQLHFPAFELFDIKARLYCFRAGYCEDYEKLLRDPHYRPNFLYFNEVKFLFKHDEEEHKREADDEEDHSYKISEEAQFLNESEEKKNSDADFDQEDDEENQCVVGDSQNEDYDQAEAMDECTIFGEKIARELQAMDKYKTVKLDFKYKVMASILEANEALSKLNRYK